VCGDAILQTFARGSRSADRIRRVACDHLSYFRDPAALRVLADAGGG
jgi:hypothetical protein